MVRLNLFFAAETDLGGGSPDLTINDIDDFLKDETPDDEKVEDDLLDNKEPVKEKEEIELEEEEPEVELDETDVTDVPRKEILAKYPTLFKDFPQLEKAYYREQKYAEILPTIQDAKEAVEKAENYEKFEQTVMNGEFDSILGSVKAADPKAFNRMVDNYLPTLAKVDQTAYYHVIGNVVKDVIATMVQESKRLDNTDLMTAATMVNQLMFGTSEYKKPISFGPGKETNPEMEQLNAAKQEFVQQKFETVLEEMTSQSNNIIKSTISKHIDPKDGMTDYVRRVAINNALQEVDELIASDTRFNAIKDKLWESAFKSNFSKSALDTIRKAYLSKAKTLLPRIIQKHRAEALKGSGKRVPNEPKEPARRDVAAHNSDKKIAPVPRGMSTLDFLNSD